ncbi:DNA methylase [Prevotella intermedia ZT]|uniref:DNA methylase n=1 Tax=Prevotella intermedia ZT TaxID=1347790 RepID=A0AAP0VGJ8_PREIN|nr:DNA methylase [Prevotella intermedia ZT]
MQDDKVTAHFRPRIFREEIVGQTDCRNKAGMVHQPLPYRFVRRGVHNSLRGNECQHTAFTEHIHPLDEKVIVQGHAGDLSGRFVRLAENWVEDGHISERNVAADHIEITSELGFDFLEASDAYLVFGMQSGEHLSRKDVFFKTEGRMPFGCNAVKRADELAQSRRGVEDTLGDDACLP